MQLNTTPDPVCSSTSNWPIAAQGTIRCTSASLMARSNSREFTQRRWQRLRKRQLRCLKLNRAYSNSFNSLNVSKCFWSWILKDRIKVQEKKKKVFVLCSRPRQNVKLGSFVQRRKRNVQKSVMHVQSCCLACLNLLLFCHCRCRRRRRCVAP